jgi:FkbM family methyltransferase
VDIKHLIKSEIEDLSGYFIHKRSDLPVGVNLKYDIQYKLNSIKIHTIFDVGANIGQTALHYKDDFQDAVIHSFEPVKATYEKLLSNTKDFPAIKCHQLAFGSEPGEMEINIYDDRDSELNSLVDSNMNPNKEAGKERINITTIDDFIAAHHISNIDLLKIDTEGFELNVLDGATKAFAENKLKLIFVEVGLDSKFNKRHISMADMHRYLSAKDFVFFGYYNIAHNLLHSRYHFANALYVNAACL